MVSNSELQKLAVELYDVGVIVCGNFVTNYGLRIPIHIDLNKLISQPQLLARLSTMLWFLIDPDEKYDRVCGVPYTALSRCGVPYTGILYAYHISSQTNIPMLMRRTEVHPYGTKKIIEGEFEVGDRIAIVENHITSGTNILEVVVDLVKERLKIGEALVVVDMEQGGKENLENAGIKVKSLFKISELIEYMREAGKLPKDRIKSMKHIEEIPDDLQN